MLTAKRILAYVDPRPESVQALSQAVSIAKRTGGCVTAIDVVERNHDDNLPAELRGLALESRRQLLQDLAERFTQEGVDIAIEVRRGSPSVGIIQNAAEGRHDLVIKTATGRSDGRLTSFGSTAMHLARKCPCAVMLLPKDPLPQDPGVAIAVNPGDEELSRQVAKRTLRAGVDVAKLVGSPPHVVHAWRLPSEPLLRRRLPESKLSSLLAAEKEWAWRNVAHLLDGWEQTIDAHQVHVLNGRADHVISRFVELRDIGLVVMGTIGASSSAGLTIGETAEEIMHRVTCGLLLIKPDHFQSSLATENKAVH